jgi:hypothetical protein
MFEKMMIISNVPTIKNTVPGCVVPCHEQGEKSGGYFWRKNKGVKSKAPVKAGKEQGVKVPRMVMDSDQPWPRVMRRLTEDAEYEGVRARVHGNLGKARISIQIDIGFGDIVAAVILFLEPLAAAIVEQKRFISVWVAPGPWR